MMSVMKEYSSSEDVNTFSEEKANMIMRALFTIGGLVSHDNPNNSRIWYSHALKFSDRLSDAEFSLVELDILGFLGQQNYSEGKHELAAKSFQRVSRILEPMFLKKPEDFNTKKLFAINLTNSGMNFDQLGQTEEAIHHFEKAWDIWKTIMMKPIELLFNIADSLHILIAHYRKKGEIEKAEQYLKDGITFAEFYFGPDHVESAKFAEHSENYSYIPQDKGMPRELENFMYQLKKAMANSIK